MRINVLQAQKNTSKSVWVTKLSVNGIVGDNDDVSKTEPAYELVVHVYAYENAQLPIRTIEVGQEYYAQNVQKYGMEALLKGVKIASILSVAEEAGDDAGELFKREVEAIAYSIVAKMEKDTFFNHYNPDALREHIEYKLLELKTKFKIEPK